MALAPEENSYNKMNEPAKKAWVEALRSGKYVQGRTSLLAEDGSGQRCCLGVLVDIVPEECKSEVEHLYEEHNGDDGSTLFKHAAKIESWCGLSEPAINRLIALNDKVDCTFEEIAEWVEVNL